MPMIVWHVVAARMPWGGSGDRWALRLEVNDILEKMERRQLTGRWVCEWD
jgi:hypothetical protein